MRQTQVTQRPTKCIDRSDRCVSYVSCVIFVVLRTLREFRCMETPL